MPPLGQVCREIRADKTEGTGNQNFHEKTQSRLTPLVQRHGPVFVSTANDANDANGTALFFRFNHKKHEILEKTQQCFFVCLVYFVVHTIHPKKPLRLCASALNKPEP
jgi:hypothetical protein